MSSNIAAKVLVITGASSGLGEAPARHLARHEHISDEQYRPGN